MGSPKDVEQKIQGNNQINLYPIRLQKAIDYQSEEGESVVPYARTHAPWSIIYPAFLVFLKAIHEPWSYIVVEGVREQTGLKCLLLIIFIKIEDGEIHGHFSIQGFEGLEK